MAGPVAPKPVAQGPQTPLSAALAMPMVSPAAIPDVAPNMPMIAGATAGGPVPMIQPLDLPGQGGIPATPAVQGNLLQGAGLTNNGAALPSVAPDTNPSDPLSIVLDMLDRPRRAVGDTLSALWNAGVDAASGKASMGTALSDVGDIASAPLRGLFSSNAADQQTSGQLIEKGVDKYGKTFDPHYKDTADNVNPILKGALGLVGDIATDPLTYVGGPAIEAALDGGKAVLTGARGIKDVGPAAQAVVKVADKAAGGSEKAASLIDDLTATGANDSSRAAAEAAAPPVPEAPGVPTPTTPSAKADALTGDNAPPAPAPAPAVSPKWTTKLQANLDDFNQQLEELQKVDPSTLAARARQTHGAKIDRITNARDALLARKYPEAKDPLAVDTAANAPVAPTAEPAASEAAASATPAAPKPLSQVLTEPTSMGDQLRASKTAPNFVKAYDRMKEVADKHGLTLLDAFTQAKQAKNMKALFGDAFLAATKNYANPERFARMLDETYRIVKEGGHLDNGDLETQLTGARSMLRGLLTDAGVDIKGTLEDRAAFKAQSTVAAATADPTSVLDKMRDPAPRMPTMAKGVEPKDLQELVKARSDALRDPLPTQNIRTETGAWTDGKGVGKSTAMYPDRMNTHNQAYDVITASQMGSKRMQANLEALGGRGYSEALRGIVMGVPGRVGLLDGLTRIRDAWGYTHHIEDGIRPPIAMSAHQAISLLGSGSVEDQRRIDKMLFNGGTPTSKTNLLEAIAAAVHGDSAEQIRAILAKDTKRARAGKQGNFLSRGKATGVIDHTVVPKGTRLPKGYSKVENPDHPGMFYIRQTADSLLDEATDLIMRRSEDLRSLAKDNAKAYLERTGSEAVQLTDAVQRATDLARITPDRMAEALQSIAEPEKAVNAAAAVAGGARGDAKALATELVKITTPESVIVDSKAKVAGAAKVAKGDLKGARAEAQKGSDAAAKETQATYEQQAAQATKLADEADGVPPVEAAADAAEEEPHTGPEWDVDQRIGLGRINRTAKDFDPDATDSRIQGRLARTMQAVFSFVNKGANATVDGLGLEELHTGRLGVTRRLAREYGMLGHDFAPYTKQMVGNRSVGSIVLDDALRRVPSAPEHARARLIVDQMVAHFMGAGVDGNGKMLAEPFLRSGVEPHYIWSLLQDKGIIPADRVYSQEIEDMLLANKSETGSFVGSIADWLVKGDPANGVAPVKIHDPNEFLQKMFTATNEFSMHVGIAQDLRSMGLKHGFLSDKPSGSLVRLFGSKDSLFSHVLGDVWADHETAVAVNRVADMLKPTKQMKSELNTILQAFDDLQQAWKYGETAIRPGTHIHNYISDHIMTWLAEGAGGYRTAMVNATKMLAANEKGGAMSVAEMMDGIMGLTHDPNAYRGPDEVLFKGRYGQMTNHEANQFISDAGLTASARNIQRTDSENLSAVGKGMERFYQSFVGKKIDKLNELQENHVRMTHAALVIQKALETGKITTRWGKTVSILDKDGKIDRDIFKVALGERVRRYHPDPNMLTQFEKDGIRRAMPFYMWNRGAVPAILEAAYLHPGRVLSFNKLSFNVGMALGVQGQNLADPYPNGAWPSFLLNQMQGPQANINGSLFTANPGIPTWDVANMFTDPNQITGAISPLLAIPTEMATGKGWESHEPITNWYDAIDSQLPGVATIASMTGYSPTNSLVSALSGGGPQKSTIAIQGLQDPIQPTVTGLGYGLGINTQHVNKTSYQMAGVAQQQQRLSQIMSGVAPQFGH